MIRVVLWTTGHVGRYAGRAIATHPGMEIVGAYAHSPEKIGKDVGTLIGIEPLGIAATADVDALLALRPDVVAHYPMVFPIDIAHHTEVLCRILRAGSSVVSTANIITGRWWGARAEIERACRDGGTSFFGSGLNPGFVSQMALTAAGACSSVERLSVWEEAECSGYDSFEMWDAVGLGRAPDAPGVLDLPKAGTNVCEDGVAMIADALDLALDDIRCDVDVALAREDLALGFMDIPAGHIAGMRIRWLGITGGREVIELGSVWKMTERVEPNWTIRHGWHVEITGVPVMRVHVAGHAPDDDPDLLMTMAMRMAASPTVHAIPHVLAAGPGIVTYKDLPLVTAAGCATAAPVAAGS